MAHVYLDHAATTPLDPEVREAMLAWLGPRFGNASSRHALGVRAREAVDRARAQVARSLAARPAAVVFTSGGTEANAMAVLGLARAGARRGRHVLVGPTEHACVRENALALRAEGFEVEFGRLDARGALDLDHFASRMRPDTVLTAHMLVQNEVGTIYPVREVARALRSRSPYARLHVDAVQAFGKLELSLEELGADTLAISAHKVHGPQGAGALVRGDVPLAPLVHGGGQEGGARPGTENVAAIVGFGAAAELAEREREAFGRTARAARAVLAECAAQAPGTQVLEPGRAAHGCVDSILALRVPSVPAEVLVHHLEERGVVASAGAACQAHRARVSPTLTALGLSESDARHVLRFSLARTTTRAEAERAGAVLAETCHSLAAALR